MVKASPRLGRYDRLITLRTKVLALIKDLQTHTGVEHLLLIFFFINPGDAVSPRIVADVDSVHSDTHFKRGKI